MHPKHLLEKSVKFLVQTYLDVGALELSDEHAIPREDCNVELVPVRVSDEHVPSVRNIDPIGEVGDVLASDASQETPLVVEHNNAVTLKVAHVEFLA